ncbi:unnamed protein product [Colias eurytheme]|nr:unnamed protein product [Colias eurytheme]
MAAVAVEFYDRGQALGRGRRERSKFWSSLRLTRAAAASGDRYDHSKRIHFSLTIVLEPCHLSLSLIIHGILDSELLITYLKTAST